METSGLPPPEAQAPRQLVANARLFSQPARVGAASGRADCRTHVIMVEDAGQSRTVHVIEPVTDPALQALVDALLARPREPAG